MHIKKSQILASASLGLLLLGCNVIRTRSIDSEEPTTYSTQQLEEDISAYASYCRHELGFDGVEIPPMNCLDGTEIPTLIDGKPPSEAQYQQLAKSEIGCDQPSWLQGIGCVNYNFVLKRKISDDVQLALICRSRSFSTVDNLTARRKTYDAKQDLESFKKLYYFDSLGLIVTNGKSGKTCFFDQVDPVYGGFIPYPDRRSPPAASELPAPKPTEALAKSELIQNEVLTVTPDKTWKKPFQTARNDRCTICHDSGPWKHSPWLPPGLDIPANDKSIPYIAIGPSFEYWRTTFEPTAINTADIQVKTATGSKTEPQLCTSCHRIGREATCRDMINYATGHASPGKLSPAGAAARARRWMPPIAADAAALSDTDFVKHWDDHYKAHYDALRACCDNPKQDGCTQTRFGTNNK